MDSWGVEGDRARLEPWRQGLAVKAEDGHAACGVACVCAGAAVVVALVMAVAAKAGGVGVGEGAQVQRAEL